MRTSSVTRPVTRGVTSAASDKATQSAIRLTITGGGTSQWDIQYPAGTSLRTGGKAPWGYNLGIYQYYSVAEATTLIAQLYSEGCRLVRLVGENRQYGSPGKMSGDGHRVFSPIGTDAGFADGSPNKKNPTNWNKLKVYARAVEAISRANPSDPMWFVVCMEGDIRQSSTQDASGSVATGTYDYAITLPQPWETIPGGLGDWGLAGGYNVFTSNYLMGQAIEEAKAIAREFRSYDYMFAVEPLSEPLPPSGKFPGNVPRQYIYPGTLSDGVYDSAWSTASPGPGLGRRSIEDYYRLIYAAYSAIDPITPMIVGGRGGYNLAPEMQEVITALADLVAANKILATWDRLGSGTNQCTKTPGVWKTAAAMNCPLFMNQLGERLTTDGSKDPGDPNTYGLSHAVRVSKQFGTTGTIWDRRGNTTGGYGTEGSNGDGVGQDGAGGTYTVNTTRQNGLATVFGERLAALEAAAIAAATAENAYLLYVKADLSNVTKSGASVPYTLTSISPVVDPLATGLTFSAVGTVTLDYAVKDGSGNSYLPDKRLVMAIDNTVAGKYLQGAPGATVYFGSTPTSGTATGNENMAAIFAGSASAASQTYLSLGNNGTTDRYPRLTCNSGKNAKGELVGDTGAGASPTSANTDQTSAPVVVTLIKSGNAPSTAVKMWVNGIDDTAAAPGGIGTGETTAGTANTLTGQTVNSIASLTRLRIGATSNTGDLIGFCTGICLFRQAPSDANAHAIGRFFAYLQGSGYKA